MMHGLAALPKPRSTVYGPIPDEWVGTEKKGEPGPRQVKCEAASGHWIGPKNKRWCQIPPAISPPVTDNTVSTVPTGDQGAGTDLEKNVVDEGVNSAGGDSGAAGGRTTQDIMRQDIMRQDIARQQATRSNYGTPLLILAVGGGLLWYFTKKKRRAKR